MSNTDTTPSTDTIVCADCYAAVANGEDARDYAPVFSFHAYALFPEDGEEGPCMSQRYVCPACRHTGVMFDDWGVIATDASDGRTILATSDDVRAFAESYLGTLLWSGAYHCDGPCEHAEDFADVEPGEAFECPGHNLDDHYDIDDFAPDARAESLADCQSFILSMTPDLLATGANWARHGQDFALTRNGHGAGFWDRGYGDAGDRLSGAARSFGGVDVLPGDDDQLHL